MFDGFESGCNVFSWFFRLFGFLSGFLMVFNSFLVVLSGLESGGQWFLMVF